MRFLSTILPTPFSFWYCPGSPFRKAGDLHYLFYSHMWNLRSAVQLLFGQGQTNNTCEPNQASSDTNHYKQSGISAKPLKA